METHPNEVHGHRLDHERLRQLHADDDGMIASAIEMFLSDVLSNFLEMDNLVCRQDWEELAGLSHQLRPWLGLVGLTSLESSLKDLESQIKTGPDPQALQTHWSQFRAGLSRMTPVLEEELQRLG
ncbi:Hpt domain-containing protein [Larkinella soli]|uniref:Hpt domain-containing protein n=1 Tax=Larkinella soli TaxID=1770527 RepID=UPI000FFBC50C|nr:Hpt domain-containing protein [Larkinella soli]